VTSNLNADSGGRQDGTIQSVERTVRILEALRRQDGATPTAVADELGMSRGTVHHHLKTLLENGMIRKEDSEYHIGIRFLTFGGVAQKNVEIFRIAHENVDTLAAETGETARLVVRDGDRGITIHRATGDAVVDSYAYLGEPEHLHGSPCTPAGQKDTVRSVARTTTGPITAGDVKYRGDKPHGFAV